MQLDPAAITHTLPYRTLCPQGHGYHATTVEWCWRCPACGRHVLGMTEEHATRDEIAADACCWQCRTPDPRQQNF